jgi:DeoR/GlpR family transcriptional regulator of sugar metabolism
MTVRRDLRLLASDGKLERVRGGASTPAWRSRSR